ncbi:MAG: hybrid sensor histidine kinase/response regulator, partial [Prevotella sp.]|nr:hybrid sensor histidine kinase/response regulator [Prevotella sp.]
MGKLFNADNQLSSNFANYVYQDRDGFIWVSTRNGLNRYDGYQFRIFRKEDEDCGLNSNYINSITQSHDGTIFVGSHNSIQAYDGSRFNDVELKDVDGKTIHAFINYLVETKAGDLLACTSGYGILRLNAKERTGKADPALSGNQNYVRYLLEDRTGRYWILTEDHGLFLVKGKQRTSYFTDEESRSSLSMVMQDSKNNIYVPVRDKGVFRYDERQRQFVLIPKTTGLSITAFYIDTEDQLLIGC